MQSCIFVRSPAISHHIRNEAQSVSFGTSSDYQVLVMIYQYVFFKLRRQDTAEVHSKSSKPCQSPTVLSDFSAFSRNPATTRMMRLSNNEPFLCMFSVSVSKRASKGLAGPLWQVFHGVQTRRRMAAMALSLTLMHCTPPCSNSHSHTGLFGTVLYLLFRRQHLASQGCVCCPAPVHHFFQNVFFTSSHS